jgi:hypothetical protein
MKTEKKDLAQFEAMSESTQGSLIGGFSASVSAIPEANVDGLTNNCGCTNYCRPV